MSLNKPQLKTDITNLLTAAQSGNGTAQENTNLFINGLANAIEAYVKSAQINYTGGLTANGSPVVGAFGGALS